MNKKFNCQYFIKTGDNFEKTNQNISIIAFKNRIIFWITMQNFHRVFILLFHTCTRIVYVACWPIQLDCRVTSKTNPVGKKKCRESRRCWHEWIILILQNISRTIMNAKMSLKCSWAREAIVFKLLKRCGTSFC